MTWILWAVMQGNLVLVLGVAAVGNRFVTPERVDGAWFAPMLACLTLLLEFAGAMAFVRTIVAPPGESNRAAARARERLRAAGSAATSDATVLDVAGVLAGEFRSAAMVAWALLEAGGLLVAIGIYLAGPQPLLLVALPFWMVAAAFTAPVPTRTENFAALRLRAGGLSEEQGRTLWNRALELARSRPNSA